MKSRTLLILSSLVLLMASCSKKGGKSGLLVPKDAAIVIHINSKSLSSKLSWSEIMQTQWFHKLQADSASTDSLGRQLLNDPSSSGIDTQKDFVIYIKRRGNAAYLVAEGSLKDAAAYEKTILEANKKDMPVEIKKQGEFSQVILHEKTAIVWNKSTFAILSNVGSPDMASSLGGGRRMRSNSTIEGDSLVIFGQQALTLEGSQNLDQDSRFADLVADGSDLHLWMDLSRYISDMGGAMLNMTKVMTLFDGNVSALSVNFDNGKIVAKGKHYVNSQLAKVYSKNRPGTISEETLNRIASSDVVGVMALNFNPQGLKELLNLLGLDAIADVMMDKAGFGLDDFVKATKGDVVVALTEPSIKMDTIKIGNETHVLPGKPDFKFLVAASVKDRAAFEKMATLIWDISKKYRKNEEEGGEPGISYKVENNWFALSNSADLTDKFIAGKGTTQPYAARISGQNFGLYIDLQRVLKLGKSFGGESKDNQQALDASLAMWQDITARGGDFKNNSSTAEFEINLVDKNTNSLKQLNQYLDKIAMVMARKKETAIKEISIEDLKDAGMDLEKKPAAPAEK